MNERAIFEAALEIQDIRRRGEYLDQACADNAALRTRLEKLLKSYAAAGSFLDHPVVNQLPPDPAPSPDRTIELSSTAGTDEDDEQMDISFLEPSTKPGSIGKLAHYEVLQVLGNGGFGIVLKAFDEKLHRLVAIKVMSPQLAATSPPRKRFVREARATAAIKHENIVQVHSVEEQPLPYLVMEFIDGPSLQQKLDGIGPLELPEILHLGRQIASGLAAAHTSGLIHRDIKPGNILLENGAEQKVKISDFGLARAGDDASLTQSGVIAGTPMYMAPEQALGQPLDSRADLFSFGSVLYQMACGRPPFRAATTIAVLRRVVEDTPRPLQEILPEIPAWLATIVATLHAKKPEERFQSAKEVADLLAHCQAELHRNGSVESLPEIVQLTAQQKAAQPEAGHNEEDANVAAQVTLSKPASSQSSRSSPRWVAALIVIFVLCCGMGLTEATGVTNFRGTVIRLFSPDGTLVVEVDDPGVSVSIDGEELVITGAGAKEIRLKPGQYKVLARKDGKVVSQELVTVTKNGRQVVRVSQEAEPIASSAEKPTKAFALQFQGSSYVVVPSLKLPTSDPMTLDALVQINEDRGPVNLLGVPAFSLALENGLKLSHRCSLGPVGQTGELGSRKLTLGQLHHVAIVRDGSKHRLFLDGQVVARRSPQKGSLPESDQVFAIGGTGLTGVIREVRVSKKARYDDSGFLFRSDARFEPDADTLALYHCDEGQGDVLKDASGNGHDGKIVGAKWVDGVRFRKIEVKEPSSQDDWVQLFNGKDLTGWKVFPSGTGNWKVEDGCIRCSGPMSHLFTKRGDYANFHSRIEAKINSKGNSGLCFRDRFGPGFIQGYEAQISIGGDRFATGSLYPTFPLPAEDRSKIVLLQAPHKADEWFTLEVIANGSHIIIKVNGKVTVDYTDSSGSFSKGHIALQHHHAGSDVRFRKIEIKELPSQETKLPALNSLAPPPAPSAALTALRRDQISPAALDFAGGGDPKNAPASLVAVLGEPEPIHTGGITALAFSADGRWLVSGGADRTILLWEASPMKVRRALHGHEQAVTSVAITPDGRTLVSGSDDGTVKIWLSDDENQTTTLKPDLGRVVKIAASPDGRFLAAGGDKGVIKLWQWDQWQKPVTLPSESTGDVTSLAFSSDGEILACGYGFRTPGSPITLYKTSDGTMKQKLPGRDGVVYSLAFSSDGKHLASTGPGAPKVDSKTRLWDLDSGEALEMDGAAYCIGVSPNGNMLAIGGMSSAHVLDVSSGQRQQMLADNLGTYARASSVMFSPDGKTLVVGDEGGAVNFYQTSDWKLKQDFLAPGHRSSITHLAVSADGRTVLSSGLDNTLLAWDLSAPGKHQIVRSFPGRLGALTASPDGKTFATGPNPMIVWDAASLKERFKYESNIQSLAYSPDGQTLAEETWGLHRIRLWDVQLGKEIYRFLLEPGQGAIHRNPGGLTFSSEGKRLVVAGALGKVVVWDVMSGKERVTWKDKPIRSAASAPDGKTLATGHTDGTIEIREMETGKTTAAFHAHVGGVYALKFTPDGKTLFSSGADGLIQIREPTAPRPRLVIPVGPAGHPVKFDLDPSGQYLFASGPTPVIYVHRLPSDDGDTIKPTVAADPDRRAAE